MAAEHKDSGSGSAAADGFGELATVELRCEAHALADEVTESVEMLSAAQAKLSNAIAHLLRSNTELVCATVLPTACPCAKCVLTHALISPS